MTQVVQQKGGALSGTKKTIPGRPRGGKEPAGGFGVLEPEWRPRPLLISHLAALFLAGSWLLPATRALWDRLDLAVFRFFNGSLAIGEWWQFLWAAANHRGVDLFSALLAALVCFWWIREQPRQTQARNAAAFGTLVALLVILSVIAAYAVRAWISYQRFSPTLVFDDALRLSYMFTSFKAKDASAYSFPGDHAFILISIALFYAYLAPRRFVLASLVMAAVFNLPRLVSGAHWLTDDLVGGGAAALLVTAWFMATPLGYYLSAPFVSLARRVLGLFPEQMWIARRGSSARQDS